MEIDKIAVGNRIKSLRQSKGKTMQEFGELIDEPPVKPGIISRWENGSSLPNAERLKAIAKIGDISVDELLYGNMDEVSQEIIYNQVLLMLTDIMLKYLALSRKEIHAQINFLNNVGKNNNHEYAKEFNKAEKDLDTFLDTLPHNVQKIIEEYNNNDDFDLHEHINNMSIEKIIDIFPREELQKGLNEGENNLYFELH